MQTRNKSLNIPLLIFILAVVQFLHIIDFMMIMPLGNQFRENLNISPRQFSNLVSVYAYAAFASGLLSAFFIDKFNRKYVLIFFFGGFTIGTLLCGYSNTYVHLLLFRSLTGAFGGVISAQVLSIVADSVPYENRSKANGFIMMAFSVSSIVGIPLGIALADNYGWQAPFQIIGYASLILLVSLFFILPDFKSHIKEKSANQKFTLVLEKLIKNKNQLIALLYSFVLILGHFTMIPFIAPYMEANVGFSFRQVGFIYIFGGICSFIALPIVGWISDKFGNQKVFLFASACAVLPIFLITNLAVVPIYVAILITSSYFIVSAGRSVPATTLVTAVVKPEDRGGFMSFRSSANELALALGSTIAGMIVIENEVDGSLINYNYVGYITIFFTVVAVFLSFKLKREE